MPFSDANLWSLLFEHMPTPIRYTLGVLTLGLFTLASHIWLRQQKRLDIIESRYATKTDIERLSKNIATIHGDIKKLMFHLMKG